MRFVIFVCFVAFVVGVSAQETENVEVAPIECWSQLSTGAGPGVPVTPQPVPVNSP